jgi:hypothetical protein
MKSFAEFKSFLTSLLAKFEGFDSSAISEHEFNLLFSAYQDGAPIEEVAEAVVDGSAYEKFFADEEKEPLQ